MRRYRGRSNDAEPLSPRQLCPGCIISTRGYNFREGQEDHVDARELGTSSIRDPTSGDLTADERSKVDGYRKLLADWVILIEATIKALIGYGSLRRSAPAHVTFV